MNADFEKIAHNIAESIDAAHYAKRPRVRRLELIRHAVRRAILHGYKAGKNRTANEAHAQATVKTNEQTNAQTAKATPDQIRARQLA